MHRRRTDEDRQQQPKQDRRDATGIADRAAPRLTHGAPTFLLGEHLYPYFTRWCQDLAILLAGDARSSGREFYGRSLDIVAEDEMTAPWKKNEVGSQLTLRVGNTQADRDWSPARASCSTNRGPGKWESRCPPKSPSRKHGIDPILHIGLRHAGEPPPHGSPSRAAVVNI